MKKLFICVAGLFPCASLLATTGVSNFTGPYYSNSPLYNGPIGESFTVGATGGTLTNATIGIANSIAEPGTVDLALYADSSGLPGAELGDLGTVSAPASTGVGELSFSPTATLSLDSDTTYWLVATETPDDLNLNWTGTIPGNDTGLPGWSTGVQANDFFGTWNDSAGADLQISVELSASAVPEPATGALLGLAAAFGWGALRRKNRA
jgi:hypothetical protein